MKDKHNKTTDSLIKELSGELQPVKPLRHPLICFSGWLLIAALYVVCSVLIMGMRGDILEKMYDTHFLLETGLAIIISATAGASAFFLRIPDSRGALWLSITPFFFLALFSLWGLIRFVQEGYMIPEFHWVHCATNSGLFIAIPLAIITFLIFRKCCATTRPLTLLVMLGTSVGALGYLCLRLTCSMDAMGHALLYHIIPFIVIGLLLGVIATRIIRW
jgi:hypothetical protein